MNRAELRSRLTLAGLDLTDDEANELLNEADRELCVRAEWTRATVSIGPTVADQAAYSLPSTVARPLKLYVNGLPGWEPSDEETALRLASNDLYLRARGIWYISYSSAGAESIVLYPTPDEAGQSISLVAVVYPTEMSTDASSPASPADFNRYLLAYAKGTALGEIEDAAELQAFHMTQFEEGVARLRARRTSRVGHGPIQARIAGVTA